MSAIRPVTVAAVATTLLSVATVVGAPGVVARSGGHHGGGHEESPGAGVLEEVVPLDGPRGLDVDRRRGVLVSEADGTVSVVKHRRGTTTVTELGQVPGGFAPAAVFGDHGSIWAVTGKGEGPGSATLYRWQPGWSTPRPVVDLAAYQQANPDPDDLEGEPGDSNPFGLAALDHDRVLVADAGGNDLLEVDRWGHVRNVARIRPRTVEVPEGLPAAAPDGSPLPPAGTPIPAEGVPTSVVVGEDGDYYLAELRGFPATPGTSQVWRVDEDAEGAVCDPAQPYRGDCRRVVDGLTSVVDLAVDDEDLYVATLSKKTWLALELGVPGAEEGALYRVRLGRHHRSGPVELAAGQVRLPGGVEVARDRLWLTGPVLGPGSLDVLDLRHHAHP